MSHHPPPIDTVLCDPIIGTESSAYTPSRRSASFAAWRDLPAVASPNIESAMDGLAAGEDYQGGEADPLLGGPPPPPKPFYRARPLWLVPFTITAALVRGMTLAPRISVFTQLSCNNIYGNHDYNNTLSLLEYAGPITHSASFYSSLDPLGPYLHPHQTQNATTVFLTFRPPSTLLSTQRFSEGSNEEDPRRSNPCFTDPAVQAGAARLQTMMTTTMGFLSALTTGWWGHFGERHGRTKVLAIATFGLFLTDLMFILVSNPDSPFAAQGHKLLLIAPFIEGLLGGWSTLQSATSAYISDCTSSGSRAQIFSRFTGVFYVGFSLGPSVGGWLISNPVGGAGKVTSVFYVAVICSFVNFCLVLGLFPESVGKERRERAMNEYVGKGKGKGRAIGGDTDGEEDRLGQGSSSDDNGPEQEAAKGGVVRQFLSPLAVFLPAVVMDGNRKKTDWSLTLLAAVMFGYMLSSGVHQLKYLYAVHVYGWAAEQLSYYISFIGAARAIFLLFLLPFIIATFKPRVLVKKPKVNPDGTVAKKPKPTKAQLAREIAFDLRLTQCSLVVEIISNALVSFAPSPAFKVHSLHSHMQEEQSTKRSQAMFVMATSLSSLGSGAIPAMQSLALCILQVRAMEASAGNPAEVESGKGEAGVGELFGALAVLQAVGQMVAGPMLFGLVYSGTVATFPKAIFMTAAGILVGGLALVALVRGPRIAQPGRQVGKGKRRSREEEPRGRSRVAKDLRGYGSTSNA